MSDDYVDATDPAAAELIGQGRIDVEGRIVEASNVTLFCTVELDGVRAHAVYKPVAGERKLWDFPEGTLAGREIATYLVSAATGLGHVPPTVLRDGPFGEGMVQMWVDTTDDELVDVRAPEDVPSDWRIVLHAHDRFGEPAALTHSGDRQVQELAVLDVVVNNTDRKGGHVLCGSDGHVYGVDHGICLHKEPKLRTVLWGWGGEPLPDGVRTKLRSLRKAMSGELGERLTGHLTSLEVRAIAERTNLLLAEGVFPAPDDNWRAIPWPLF